MLSKNKKFDNRKYVQNLFSERVKNMTKDTLFMMVDLRGQRMSKWELKQLTNEIKRRDLEGDYNVYVCKRLGTHTKGVDVV